MGIAVIPAPSAGGKILKKLTLTGGSSWTVPSGVTDINVTLYGGGGGGGGTTSRSADTAAGSGGSGGTTTFTGATSASGGSGGNAVSFNDGYNQGFGQRSGTSQLSNTGLGAPGGFQIQGAQATTQSGGSPLGGYGANGQIISSTLTVTAGSSIGYSIGSGGNAGSAGAYGASGGAGGSGKIEIEYWV